MTEQEIRNLVHEYEKTALKGLNKDDAKAELKRYEAELRANDKYERDEKIKAERAEKEAKRIAMEKEAREKELADRQARLDAEKKAIRTEEEARRRTEENRRKAIDNYDKLSVDEKIEILTDEDDMGVYFRNLMVDLFKKFKSNANEFGRVRESLNIVDHIKMYNASPKELEQVDILFHHLLSGLVDIEKPFLIAKFGPEAMNDKNLLEGAIAENFVVNNRSIDDQVETDVKKKGLEILADDIQRYKKLAVLKELTTLFYNLDGYKVDGKKFNEELDKMLKRLQYMGFTAVKDRNEMKVFSAASDFTEESRFRKFWLENHPEKEGDYKQEDLEEQLGFVKKMAGLVCKDRKISQNVYNRYGEQVIPGSLLRKKYELRELRSAFAVQADFEYEPELKKFNEDMAFLCDYEAGDFRKLLREKPHFRNLLEYIQTGPLLRTDGEDTQKQIYEKLSKDPKTSEAISSYLQLVHDIVGFVKLEYKRQQYDKEGWTPEKEKELLDGFAKIAGNVGYHFDGATSAGDAFDYYSSEPRSRYCGKNARKSIKESLDLITYETGAMVRGWNPQDTFLFSMVSAIRSKYRELERQQFFKPKEEKKDYGKVEDDLFRITIMLDDAKTAIEKRAALEKFEDFVRNHVDDKELLAPLLNQQLTYDRTKARFDADYKEAVRKDLEEVKGNPGALASTMIKIQRIAMERGEDFHTEIISDFIRGQEPEEKKKLQTELYRQRLHGMVKRGEKNFTEQQEVYKRDELAELRSEKNLYNDIFAQIGRLLCENDDVAAIDKIFGCFQKPLTENEKEYLKEEFKRSPSYHEQYFETAERMDEPKKDQGITIVKAPEGGYNIKYDKPVSEIYQNFLQKVDSQVEDLATEYARIQATMRTFMAEGENRKAEGKIPFSSFNPGSENDPLWRAMNALYLMHDGSGTIHYVDGLNKVKEEARNCFQNVMERQEQQKRGENTNKRIPDDEVKFYGRIIEFCDQMLKTLTPENYPDLAKGSSFTVKDYRKRVEITKTVLNNQKKKWVKQPTERIKKKEEAAKNNTVEKFFSALALDTSRRELEKDAGFSWDFFYKPSMLIRMRFKCFIPLLNLDGAQIRKLTSPDEKDKPTEAEILELKKDLPDAYVAFYKALKTVVMISNPKELDKEDGFLLLEKGLRDLQKATDTYLASIDPSENAGLRKMIARDVKEKYLSPVDRNVKVDRVAEFIKWGRKDPFVASDRNKLPEEARKKYQDTLDAEARAKADEKKQEDEKKARKKRYDEFSKKYINERDQLKNEKAILQETTIPELENQIAVLKRNIPWFKEKHDSRLEKAQKDLPKKEQALKDARNRIPAIDKRINEINAIDFRKEFEKQEASAGRALEEQKKAKELEAAKLKKQQEDAKKEEENKKKLKEMEKPQEGDLLIEEDENIIPENKDNNIIVQKNNNIIPQKDENNIIDENDDIIPEKLSKKDLKKQKASYDTYFKLHTGDFAGDDPKTRLENFAKVVTARALQQMKKKFDVDLIHRNMAYVKEIYSLDHLKQDKLVEILQTPDSAFTAGEKIRRQAYGVKDTDWDDYVKEMKVLRDNMIAPEKRSTEYQKLYRLIDEAAKLTETYGPTGQNLSNKGMHSQFIIKNIELVNAVADYMKGKKSVRSSNNGKDNFDSALDALAIVSKYSKGGMNYRVKDLLDRINHVRRKNPANCINKDAFTQNYGGEHAKQVKQARDQRNAAKNRPAAGK